MHLRPQPGCGTGVQLGDRAGRPDGGHLLEEGGLELAEGSLDLALSLGIPGGAGTEGEAVGGCKLERLGDEAEGLAPGHPEGPHAVRPPDPGHAAGVLEEAHQALEGVGPVHRRGEPPVAVAAPAQDRPEAVQLAQSPGPAPFAAVGPVELELLACGGLDRHAHRSVAMAAHPPGLPEVAHQRRVAAIEALGPQQALHRGTQQIGVRLQDLGDPAGPVLVHHEQGRVALALGRRPAVSQPVAHRRRVVVHRNSDLTDLPALSGQCHDIHVLLLSHHLGAPPARRAWSPTGWRGNDRAEWISLRRRSARG